MITPGRRWIAATALVTMLNGQSGASLAAAAQGHGDEGGGYWGSGFFQPIDFFGDGPRIPFIAVSKYSRGGKIVHAYADHASVVKFIERNWHLKPLTARSRDNLPNPVMSLNNPYV